MKGFPMLLPLQTREGLWSDNRTTAHRKSYLCLDRLCKETNTAHMNYYNPVRKKKESQEEYMTRGRRKAMKLKGEARNKANTQSTACNCLHACCGWATDLILSFRAAAQRRKIITYKTTSVHMTKINQEKGTIPGRETGDIFTVGPH